MSQVYETREEFIEDYLMELAEESEEIDDGNLREWAENVATIHEEAVEDEDFDLYPIEVEEVNE